MNVLMKIISVLLVTGGAFASATNKPSLHSRVEKVLRNLRVHNRPRHLLNAQKIHQSPRTQVDYGALYHPFDERRRKLQTDGTDYDTTQGYQPLRIKFLTEPLDDLRPSLDAVNQARVDAIKDRVLPMIEDVWTNRLSVYPAVGPLPLSEDLCAEGGFELESLASAYANGVDDADLILLVTAEECDEGGLASATPCALDQFDRPINGQVFMCLNDSIDPDDDDVIFDAAATAIHEVAHVLGMSSQFWVYFRDPTTGEPLTPRLADGSVALTNATCVDGFEVEGYHAGENVLKQFNTTLGVTEKEQVHYEIVTPRVQAVVRNYFDCQSLEGARLENNPTEPTDCTGSHWDERQFYGEIMSAIASNSGDGQADVLSPLTFAILEDSGWYKVTYEGTTFPGYGLGLGCDFVNGPCVVDDAIPDYGKGLFCDSVTPTIDGSPSAVFCDPSYTSFAFCGLYNASADGTDTTGLVRYFSDPNLYSDESGLDQYDACPLPIEALPTTCTDENTSADMIYFEGEAYGPNSRCINAVSDELGQYPVCLETVCQNDQVTVGDFVCEFDFQTHIINLIGGGTGTIECPRLTSVCPQLFCPAGCSGRGVCNFDSTPAKCECFDSDNGTPSCDPSFLNSTRSPVMAPTTPFPPTPATPTPAPDASSSTRAHTMAAWVATTALVFVGATL